MNQRCPTAIFNLDDLLQVLPRLFERLHGEPGVRVRADAKGFDLLVEGLELVEVFLRRGEAHLELGVGLAQGPNLLHAGK